MDMPLHLTHKETQIINLKEKDTTGLKIKLKVTY